MDQTDIRKKRIRTKSGDEVPVFETEFEKRPILLPRNYEYEWRRAIKLCKPKVQVNFLSSMNA